MPALSLFCLRKWDKRIPISLDPLTTMSAEGQRSEEGDKSLSQTAGSRSSDSQLSGWDDSNLHPAAMFDNAELLECLLQGDAKKHINNTDFSHRTPVYTAVLNNSFRALEVLLDHGGEQYYYYYYVFNITGYNGFVDM